MKSILRWAGKVLGTALCVVLVLCLLPYASRLAGRLLPDESGAAIKATAVLSTQLSRTARLETLHVEEEGVLNEDIQAAFIGTVASVNVRYTYTASFGVDLQQVRLRTEGDTVTFILPAVELISDSLTPVESYRNTSWLPSFDDNDYQRLLDEERLNCRERYLSGDHAEELWNATTAALEETAGQWLADLHGTVQLAFELSENPAEGKE